MPFLLKLKVNKLRWRLIHTHKQGSKDNSVIQKPTKPEWFLAKFFSYMNTPLCPMHAFHYHKCQDDHDKIIRIPSLILNAANDPVLSESCAILDKAKKSDYLFSEYPAHGGHCGFYAPNQDGIYWGDYRTWEFVKGNHSR